LIPGRRNGAALELMEEFKETKVESTSERVERLLAEEWPDIFPLKA